MHWDDPLNHLLIIVSGVATFSQRSIILFAEIRLKNWRGEGVHPEPFAERQVKQDQKWLNIVWYHIEMWLSLWNHYGSLIRSHIDVIVSFPLLAREICMQRQQKELAERALPTYSELLKSMADENHWGAPPPSPQVAPRPPQFIWAGDAPDHCKGYVLASIFAMI